VAYTETDPPAAVSDRGDVVSDIHDCLVIFEEKNVFSARYNIYISRLLSWSDATGEFMKVVEV